MNVLEHLTMAAFAGWLEEHAGGGLDDLAFVVDGPLALFGEPSRLRRTFLLFWQRLAQRMLQHGGPYPVLLGVEKTGEFVDHAQAIAELVPPGHLMHLDMEYIQNYIRFKDVVYGIGNYFGRKFIYRTATEQTIVFTVPPIRASGLLPYRENDPFDWADYPTIGTTCKLLDHIGTRLHDDALIPLALAHKWAAYPLRTASNVLKLHARERLAT
jgi:hypothetical protein